MTFAIDTFKANLLGGGARPNLFKVVTTFPFGGDVSRASFLVKAASLPASTIAPISVNFRGRQMNVPGDRTFSNWTITIVNDTDFKIRNDFERWMARMNGHVSNIGIATPLALKTDMEVIQLGKDGRNLQTYVMRGVFPSSVSEIALSMDSSNSIEEYTVTLEVDYWTNASSQTA
jgi:hypothetical protein